MNTMKLEKIIAILLSLFFITNAYGQGWEKLYSGDSLASKFIEQTADGGYLLGAQEKATWQSSNTNLINPYAYLIRTDINGDTLWTKDVYNLALTSGGKAGGGNYILAGSIPDNINNISNAGIVKVDSIGDVLWTRSFVNTNRSIANAVQQTTDGGFILAGSMLLGSSGWLTAAYLIKTDGNGNTLWTKEYGGTKEEVANDVQQTTDGGYILAGSKLEPGTLVSRDFYLIKTDAIGDTLWTKTFDGNGNAVANAVKQTADGGYIIVGTTRSNTTYEYDIYLIKTDPNGNTIWTKTFDINEWDFGTSIIEVPNGGYLITGQTSSPVQNTEIYVVKTDLSGNLEWSNTYGGTKHDFGAAAVASGNGYAVVGSNDQWVFNPNSGNTRESEVYLIRMDSVGDTYTNYIKGNVFNDTSTDCLKDPGEDNMSEILVEAVGNQTWYGSTDTLGNYCIRVDTGSYIVTLNTPTYWQACTNNIPVSFSNFYSSDTVNFPLQASINCPLMEIDLSAPFLRSTGGGSSYTVSYCNQGTIDAINASIEVTIDNDLNILSASIPIANQTGNVLMFNIGDVAYRKCGSFTIDVVVGTAAIPGQTHCSEAHIYPDSLCIHNPWAGAIIEANAACQNDSIAFKLENVGGGTFDASDFYVFEDHVIMRIGNTGNISIGNSFDLTIPADTGKTYRISVPQNVGFSKLIGDTIATAAIEGCVPLSDGTFNTGFITQFSNGNSSPFIAVDCQQNIASYDPNDKSVQPVGYDSQHYIYDYTDLDYKIRFQNTGTDTAFLVVIRDTISPLLDITTLTMGASSHTYTWRIYGDRILEIAYDNILLPDSTVNEPASNGFVRYRIEQNAGNVAGDVIYNAADIYFDYNAPITTNQTFHTIGDDFVIIISNQTVLQDDNLEVKVYPNPYSDQAILEVSGKSFLELTVTIYDVMGRPVLEKQATGNNQIQLSRGNLIPGIYFYQLVGDNALINAGKIVVQ